MRRKAELPKRGRRARLGSPAYRASVVFTADMRGAKLLEREDE